MSLLDGLRHRLHVLRRCDEYMHNAERELHFHAELETLARAKNYDVECDAELAARRSVGNVTYYREETRRMTLLRRLDRLQQDTTYAMRGLRRSPGLTFTIVVTLALGFGVNAAMYSMIEQVFSRAPAGVTNPRQVRRMYEDLSDGSRSADRMAWPYFTYPHYRALASAAAPLQLAAFTSADSESIIADSTRIAAHVSEVTANYFSILGARPARGRLFSAEENQIATPTPVAVISDAFWRREFNEDPQIVGRSVSVKHRPVTIIGVASDDFTGVDIDATDMWLPANMYSSRSQTGDPWYETYESAFAVLGRIETPGDQARLLAVAPAALRSVHLVGGSDSTMSLIMGSIVLAAGPAKPVQELLVAKKLSWIALLVLLIASANVTNLLLLRAAGRKREIAVRRALGVSYARLCSQLATEGLLLALLGGAAALLVAFWTGIALRREMLPKTHWASGPVDAHTVAFLVAVSLVIGLSAGLVPAFHAMRPNLVDSLKAGMRSGAYQRSILRSALVIVQTALCVVLLVGAGLFVRSLDNVESIGVGYGIDGVTTFYPSFVDPGTNDDQRTVSLRQVVERLSNVDGVIAAAYSMSGPMLGSAFQQLFLPDRDTLPRLPGDIGPSYNVVSPDYFEATDLPIRSGRGFTAADNAQSERVVVVSQAMARTYWPGETALGKCLIVGKRTAGCRTVVGIVADAHRRKILESPIVQYYLPLAQKAGVAFATARVVVVRARPARQQAVVRETQQLMTQLVSGLDGVMVERMSDALAPELRPWRLGATLFSAFGILALIVAAVGIYSVVAYSVAQRTHELGIRIALGARASDVFDTVLSEGARVLLIGIGLGLGGALALGRFVASLLFGITPSDPSVLIGASVTLLTLATIACLLPGWRAARVDPATALRAD